ncbi:PREDICTED: uncharacterized protein LOC109592973 [Amphimedon queenslandica]|uniref:Uncharacterized protein n=2 Tax=Amphimedon queenslandica TaxID=400682 RepID=A0AAN0K3R9_AMPQE|nr:PREDICTED: uncharacterized protein LOC109592973 [Amphimedon queenslandica]|eukprot:XP_019863818.1 PREDICTED: uncharacterized protein LOC109592973 [Amphimedon queenslandica]
MSANNCLCLCSLSCDRGYTPSANCTSCVLTNICEASNPCGTADCSLGSQPDQYICYCAANTSNTQSQSLSASIIAIITVLSLIIAVCIALIVVLVVVVVINNKKQKQQLQQPSHDYDIICPTASDPVTQTNQAYQVGRQLF